MCGRRGYASISSLSQEGTAGLSLFPEPFLWGALLSAHQIEGGDVHSDWWRWEQRPGRIADGSTSERAADFLNRYTDDLHLAKKLGLNALLISLSWARIEPEQDVFDEAALDRYRDMLDQMHHSGLTPVCALQEGAYPLWFTEQGGWGNPDALPHFSEYCNRVAERLGQHCGHWIPLIEPEFWLRMSLESRLCPAPASVRPVRSRQAFCAAFSIAHTALCGRNPKTQVGISLRARNLLPEDPDSAWDLRTARRLEITSNHALLRFLYGNASAPRPDFIGISYYGEEKIRFTPWRPRMGFARCGRELRGDAPEYSKPAGLERILREMATYETPLLITGNGIATSTDEARCAFLLDHVHAVQLALEQGTKIMGYFHRSLLDSWEWSEGFTRQFGLVHVDRHTLARTPQPSAFLYGNIAKTRQITRGAIARYAPEWTPPMTGESS